MNNAELEQNILPVSEDPIASEGLTDDQVDKFFEEAANEQKSSSKFSRTETQEGSKEEASQESQIPEEGSEKTQEALEEEKHARNYQAAMKEERLKRQELQREVENHRQKMSQMEQTFQKIVERTQQDNQPRIPSYEEDPLENMRMKQQQIENYVVQQNEYLQKQHQAVSQEQSNQQFVQSYMSAAQEYSKQVPDFSDAYKFMERSRIAEHLASGFTEKEASQLLQADEATIVQRAFREGVNPAERIYALAKARGYQKQNDQASNSNTSNPIMEKLDQIEKGISNSKSLGSGGGKAPSSSQLTLEKLAIMDDDEFDRNWAKVMKAG